MFGSNFTDLFPGANKVSKEYGGQIKHKHKKVGGGGMVTFYFKWMSKINTMGGLEEKKKWPWRHGLKIVMHIKQKECWSIILFTVSYPHPKHSRSFNPPQDFVCALTLDVNRLQNVRVNSCTAKKRMILFTFFTIQFLSLLTIYYHLHYLIKKRIKIIIHFHGQLLLTGTFYETNSNQIGGELYQLPTLNYSLIYSKTMKKIMSV